MSYFKWSHEILEGDQQGRREVANVLPLTYLVTYLLIHLSGGIAGAVTAPSFLHSSASLISEPSICI